MPAPRDPNLLLAAARAYFLEGKSQAEIAVALETSRSNVSRMLTEAQRQGIVEIKIHDPSGRVRELELALRKKFGLKDVLVAASRGGSANRLAAQVGVLGAQLLTELLPQADTIAMSWGHSLQHVVYGIDTIDTTNTEVVQLVGGMAAISNEISGHELVRELASRVGAAYRFMHAPATFSSKQARDTMAGEPSVVESLAAARAADLAFVGIGSPAHGSSAALLASMDLSPKEEKEFWAAVPTERLRTMCSPFRSPTSSPSPTSLALRLVGPRPTRFWVRCEAKSLTHSCATKASLAPYSLIRRPTNDHAHDVARSSYRWLDHPGLPDIPTGDGV